MNPPNKHDNLDVALLATADAIQPSSGFTTSVMNAVREQALAPLPIPFPWKRTLPGAIAVVGCLAYLLAHPGSQPVPLVQPSLPTLASLAAAATQHPDAAWLAFSVALTLASLLFTWRLASPHS
jgi:hypothetical protein